MIIKKVWERNANGKYPQKLVTIPQSSNIKTGDNVMITKVKGEQEQALAEKNLSALANTSTESANQSKANKILEEIGL